MKILFTGIFVLCLTSAVYATQQSDNDRFFSQISSLPFASKQLVEKYSWHPGCPVAPSELAYVKLSYWGFDNRPHRGVLIVNQQVAPEVVTIFADLFREKFPIQKMIPADFYQGSDAKIMADNDTSAFLCRAMTENPRRLSTHSYGIAIDINPKQNPFVPQKSKSAKTKAFADRGAWHRGMIVQGDATYQAFIQRGWSWGGDWRNPKDYQHFELHNQN